MVADAEIGAQQACRRAALAVDIATAHPVVTGVQLGNHLDHQAVEVLAPADMIYQRPVLLVDGVPVQPVKVVGVEVFFLHAPALVEEDRKSTRLNSSHEAISYAVFCLKKKR